MGQYRSGNTAKLNDTVMQKARQAFVGIDVSKLHFDASLMVVDAGVKGAMETARFENSATGLDAFGLWLKAAGAMSAEQLLVVMENTGIYHRMLWGYCSTHNIPVYIGNGAHIKWSLGITRGKNDVIDSKRLCKYASKEHEELKAAPALDPVLLRLKDLWTSRGKLLAQLNSNKVFLKELAGVSEATDRRLIEQAFKTAMSGIAKSIKAIEMQIRAILAANEELNTNYELLLSIPGIGHVTAIYLLCCTVNFAARPGGKQLACYAGVAPFGHTSGSSVKGKPKVHKMANKELKRLLYMGALSVIKSNQEMKTYYERKTSEGKHPLAVINAVENKLLLRVAAVVKNRKPYVDKTKIAA
jgi:transposase